MKFPVDDDMLTAWSTLLDLTKEQIATTLATSRRRCASATPPAPGRAPLQLRAALADMDVDEFALMFLTTGLRQRRTPRAGRRRRWHARWPPIQANPERH